MVILAATSTILNELRTSVQAVTYVKGREEDHIAMNNKGIVEVTKALTKIFECSVDKRFPTR